MSAKILILELWAKILLANQISKIFKKWYLKKEVNNEIYFGIHINIDVFYKFILSFWMYIVSHAQSTKNKTFAYLCNISRKRWGMKLIFWRWFFLILQIDTKFFCKLIISLWVCIARHFQSTQNNKCAISLQYLM